MPSKTKPDPTMFSTKEAAEDAAATKKAKRRALMKQTRQESDRALAIANADLPDLAFDVPHKVSRDPTMISPDEAGQAVVARWTKRKALKKKARRESKYKLATTNGGDNNAKKGLEPEETSTKRSTKLALTNGGIGDGQTGLEPEESRSTHVVQRKTKPLQPPQRRIKRRLTLSDRLKQSVVWRAGRDADEEMFSVSNSSSDGRTTTHSFRTIGPEPKTRKENKPSQRKRPSVRFIKSMPARPTSLSKGRGEHPQRNSTIDRLKYSMGWVSGRDEEIDYDLDTHWSETRERKRGEEKQEEQESV